MTDAPTTRVVITGGPGTGKSTLLRGLQELGYPIHREISRDIIRQELQRGSNHLPWEDLNAFSDKVFAGQKEQYREAVPGQVNFFDRGVIDVIAYLRKDGYPHQRLDELVPHYPYHRQVFLTPPWPGIYRQDAERREDLATMNAIHNALLKSYDEHGYQVIEVPLAPAPERVVFVLDQLDLP